MSESVIYETLKKPIDIRGDGSVVVTAIGRIEPSAALHAENKLYERRDLFVKSFRLLPISENNLKVIIPTVFIQDSVEHQSGGKISAFSRRITDMANEAVEMKSYQTRIVPTDWHARPYTPTITVSIKCDDATLSPKSQKIIATLNEAIASGVKIEFINRCAQNSPWTQVLTSMIAAQKQH